MSLENIDAVNEIYDFTKERLVYRIIDRLKDSPKDWELKRSDYDQRGRYSTYKYYYYLRDTRNNLYVCNPFGWINSCSAAVFRKTFHDSFSCIVYFSRSEKKKLRQAVKEWKRKINFIKTIEEKTERSKAFWEYIYDKKFEDGHFRDEEK